MSRRLIPRPERFEEQVLFRCARHPAPPDLSETLSQVEDWDRLLRLSEAHGMSPLLWRRVLDAPAGVVPPPILERAGELYRQNLRRNLTLTARFVKLTGLLRGAGIRAVLFKGPDLAERGYGDPGLRRYLDLDLLVSKDDARAGRETLLANGFRPERELTPAMLEAQLRTQCDFKFFGEDGGEAVELHWALTPRYLAFHVDVEGMLDRAVPMEYAGAEVLVLAPEDVVTALCVHGMKHLWERLGWIHDLARWIDTYPSLDLDGILAAAKDRGLARVVDIGLLLAGDLARRRSLLRQADHIAVGIARQLGRLLFDAPASAARAIRIHMSSREHGRDALRYLTRLAFTTTHRDWTTLPLSERMFALRGAWRPVRLLLDSIA